MVQDFELSIRLLILQLVYWSPIIELFQDLETLRGQLYSAAEYFELSYNDDNQKQMSVTYSMSQNKLTCNFLLVLHFKVYYFCVKIDRDTQRLCNQSSGEHRRSFGFCNLQGQWSSQWKSRWGLCHRISCFLHRTGKKNEQNVKLAEKVKKIV